VLEVAAGRPHRRGTVSTLRAMPAPVCRRRRSHSRVQIGCDAAVDSSSHRECHRSRFAVCLPAIGPTPCLVGSGTIHHGGGVCDTLIGGAGNDTFVFSPSPISGHCWAVRPPVATSPRRQARLPGNRCRMLSTGNDAFHLHRVQRLHRSRRATAFPRSMLLTSQTYVEGDVNGDGVRISS